MEGPFRVRRAGRPGPPSRESLDIMGTILFKPNQAFGEGLFFDNRECKKRRLANMPTRALAF